MSAQPWSQDYNPRHEGQHAADWLRREVALIDKLAKDGKGARCIMLTAHEARSLLAMIPEASEPAAEAVPA